MNFIAQCWWVWLLGVIVFGALSFSKQLGHMRKIMRSTNHKSSEAAVSGFLNNFGQMFALGFLAWVCGILLLISIVVNLLQYATK